MNMHFMFWEYKMDDKRLGKYLLLLLLFPLALAYCSGDRYRYPCQDPDNWDKQMCKLPHCDVNRTCPEHIFKGGRDPRLGPPPEKTATPAPATTGVNCK